MDSSSSSPLLCPACGGENASDSRFCRHCGAAMTGAAQASPAVATSSAVATPPEAATADATTTTVTAPAITPLAPHHPAVDLSDDGELSSPSEIDGRRARQLLERALYLSERNDMNGAILATRQSIALAPTAPGGHSMLGLLLERTGDITHAVGAYEKAVQLAPNSAHERESLHRLQEKLQAQKGATLFHFDDEELFADTTASPAAASSKDGKENTAKETPAATPTEIPVAAAVPAVAAAVPLVTESSIAEEDDSAPLPNIGVGAPGLPAAAASAIIAQDHAEAPAALSDFHGLDTNAKGTAVSHHGPEAKLPPSRPTAASAAAAPVAAPLAPAPAIAERRGKDRRHTAVPVVNDRRSHMDRRSAATKSRAAVPVAPIYIANADAAGRQGSLSNLWSRPSFYGRSLPLVGATVLALGFLTWARSWAVTREPAPVVMTAPGTSTTETATDPIPQDPVVTPQVAGAAPPPLAAVGNAPAQTGGFPITNRPVTVAPANSGTAPAAGGTTTRPATASTGGVATPARPRVAAGQRPSNSPRFPRVIPPAPIPAAGSNSGGGSGGSNSGGGLSLPAPNIAAPPSAPPPVAVIPSDNTPPLNPAGSSNRGYVRITQGRIGTSAVPQRPAASANADERNAANASNNGQTDRAIDRLSAAINSDSSDAGFRYQQRASLFLDRGDYARAADDFQSAISAYNDQIGRGEQVNAARAGIKAARSGLNLALAGKRN